MTIFQFPLEEINCENDLLTGNSTNICQVVHYNNYFPAIVTFSFRLLADNNSFQLRLSLFGTDPTINVKRTILWPSPLIDHACINQNNCHGRVGDRGSV